MFTKTSFSIIVSFILLQGCSQNENPHEVLLGTLWLQTSTEYKMITTQAYELARIRLMEGLKDSEWTAAVEQISNYSKLPPAIVLDLDETVLNNSAYEARLVNENKNYEEST